MPARKVTSGSRSTSFSSRVGTASRSWSEVARRNQNYRNAIKAEEAAERRKNEVAMELLLANSMDNMTAAQFDMLLKSGSSKLKNLNKEIKGKSKKTVLACVSHIHARCLGNLVELKRVLVRVRSPGRSPACVPEAVRFTLSKLNRMRKVRTVKVVFEEKEVKTSEIYLLSDPAEVYIRGWNVGAVSLDGKSNLWKKRLADAFMVTQLASNPVHRREFGITDEEYGVAINSPKVVIPDESTVDSSSVAVSSATTGVGNLKLKTN